MSRYKIGDKVRIRSYQELKKEFGSTPGGSIKTRLPIYKGPMSECCGKVVTITDIKRHEDKNFTSFCFKEIPFFFSHDAIELVNRKHTPKYFTGEIVCIENYSDFTVGRIYKVKNGVLHDDVGYDFEEIKSVTDLNERLYSQFIEVIR